MELSCSAESQHPDGDSRKSPTQLLSCEWSFWYFQPETDSPWEDCLHDVAAFKSTEEFWILYNSVKLPTELANGCDYCVFRHSIRPMWEDQNNVNGGRWVIVIDKRIDDKEVNKLWRDSLLILIKESLPFSASICGVVFSNRWKFFKIAIWLNNSNEIEAIGKELKTKLHLSDSLPCLFECHRKSNQMH